MIDMTSTAAEPIVLPFRRVASSLACPSRFGPIRYDRTCNHKPIILKCDHRSPSSFHVYNCFDRDFCVFDPECFVCIIYSSSRIMQNRSKRLGVTVISGVYWLGLSRREGPGVHTGRARGARPAGIPGLRHSHAASAILAHPDPEIPDSRPPDLVGKLGGDPRFPIRPGPGIGVVPGEFPGLPPSPGH